MITPVFSYLLNIMAYTAMHFSYVPVLLVYVSQSHSCLVQL